MVAGNGRSNYGAHTHTLQMYANVKGLCVCVRPKCTHANWWMAQFGQFIHYETSCGGCISHNTEMVKNGQCRWQRCVTTVPCMLLNLIEMRNRQHSSRALSDRFPFGTSTGLANNIEQSKSRLTGYIYEADRHATRLGKHLPQQHVQYVTRSGQGSSSLFTL